MAHYCTTNCGCKAGTATFDHLKILEYAVTQGRTFDCNCVGGPNCCIKRAEREREAAIRADERRKVLAELEQRV